MVIFPLARLYKDSSLYLPKTIFIGPGLGQATYDEAELVESFVLKGNYEYFCNNTE